MSSNENNKTKKRAKGPKYHKWNPNKNAYFLLKPYQLLKDPDVENGRLMPLGMRELLTDEQYKEYSDYAPIKIVDDKHKEKKKLSTCKPTQCMQTSRAKVDMRADFIAPCTFNIRTKIQCSH
jgi:hypothetical protein